MAGVAESSSTQLKNDKPVIVRVKRKVSQYSLDAFWLEINEPPLKRALVDFDKLSISESSKKDQELKSRKVFVRRVETITTSDVSADILQSFVSNSPDAFPSKEKSAETRRSFRTENKQHQWLLKARERQENSSRNARFEQIWRSRKEKKDFVDDGLNDMCRLYDIVRIEEEKSIKVQADRSSELEDERMMSQFLPLLKEFLPSAAVEVEADIHGSLSKRSDASMPDNYVYDYYAVEEGMQITEEDAGSPFPLVQVDDDDSYYDGPDDSEYETDDSNAENNPLNEYPDEEPSESEDQHGNGSSDEKSESEEKSSGAESEEDNSDTEGSFKAQEYVENDSGDNAADFSYEDDVGYSYEDYDGDCVGCQDYDGDEDWR